MFITFEGGEGAGKTTQIKMLAKALEEQGRDVVLTREPGGTIEAEKIRALLVEKEGGAWTPLAETLLFFTARHMHVETLIKPALKEDKIVLCDRFTDSTIAYQSYGHGLDLDLIKKTEDLSIGNFKPDLTFLLDLPAEKGLQRSKKRLNDVNSAEEKFEDLDIGFHEKLREGFLQIAKSEPERVHVIDALQPLEKIAQDIKEITDNVLV